MRISALLLTLAVSPIAFATEHPVQPETRLMELRTSLAERLADATRTAGSGIGSSRRSCLEQKVRDFNAHVAAARKSGKAEALAQAVAEAEKVVHSADTECVATARAEGADSLFNDPFTAIARTPVMISSGGGFFAFGAATEAARVNRKAFAASQGKPCVLISVNGLPSRCVRR